MTGTETDKILAKLEVLRKELADQSLLVAREYRTKEEAQRQAEQFHARLLSLHERIDAYAKEERAARLTLSGILVAVAGVVAGIIAWVTKVLGGGEGGN